MECDICLQNFSTKKAAVCVSCAQATLYKPRIGQAAALLGREKSQTHTEAILRPGNDGVIAALPEDADWDAITLGIKTNVWERCKLELEAAEPRFNSVAAKAVELRRQIEECKDYISKSKENNQQRRRDLAQKRKQFQEHVPTIRDPIRAASRKTTRTLDKVHLRIAEAREFLCREVAILSGLEKVKKPAGRSEHQLNGVIIPDLRDLNGTKGRIRVETVETPYGIKSVAEQHELISASLDNICRFLGICCCYLSIRLPAEVLLPHDDFPNSMILQERASYRYSSIEFSRPAMSRSSSSTTLRPKPDLPRPRPLQLDRPITKLQQEDPKAFGLFIEGITWLAWNIAWLCRTQGIDSINTFEDVCSMGRNLDLLFSPRSNTSLTRPKITRNFPSTGTDDRTDITTNKNDRPRFGTYSHSSAKYSLAGSVGAELRDGWRLESGSHNRLFDRLRNFLTDEARKAEWTFIDDREWDDELEHEKPVLVGGPRNMSNTLAISVMTVAGNDGTNATDQADTRKEGTGWMKVRGRAADS